MITSAGAALIFYLAYRDVRRGKLRAIFVIMHDVRMTLYYDTKPVAMWIGPRFNAACRPKPLELAGN